MQSKITTFEKIAPVIAQAKKERKKIIHCHGVFDLLHPGHIRHFKEAKQQGDLLIVTVTPDQYVNKGPGRPAFKEALRLETLASLSCIDYVILNDKPDAIHTIKRIRPDLYVKGKEYENHSADVTEKIAVEAAAVEQVKGAIYYTHDITFSSSSLLNTYFDRPSKQLKQFLKLITQKYSLQDLLYKIDSLADVRVLVIGDAIIDEYQYTKILGQSGKGIHMTAECLDKEIFLGGALIIANHIAQFSNHITLLTSIGKNCSHRKFLDQALDAKIEKQFILLENKKTLTKKRYVSKDGNRLSKLFETYSTNDSFLNDTQTDQVTTFLRNHTANYDLILVCDFGNGFTNPSIVQALSKLPNFLAINTQLNSGNRGFNVVTHYQRADFISLNEPELRLSAHDRYTALEVIAKKIANRLHCPNICITRGVKGALCVSKDICLPIPAFMEQAIDRVGAGDSFFALSALSAAKKYDLSVVGLFGSIASAMDVQIIGNKHPIQKMGFKKFLIRMIK